MKLFEYLDKRSKRKTIKSLISKLEYKISYEKRKFQYLNSTKHIDILVYRSINQDINKWEEEIKELKTKLNQLL